MLICLVKTVEWSPFAFSQHDDRENTTKSNFLVWLWSYAGWEDQNSMAFWVEPFMLSHVEKSRKSLWRQLVCINA